jgi:hypothetical protein
MQQLFAAALEARASVGHHAFALGRANLATEIGLARLAKLAFSAFWSAWQVSYEFNDVSGVLEGDYMVTRLNVGNAFTNAFNDTGSFVTQNDWECAFGVFA